MKLAQEIIIYQLKKILPIRKIQLPDEKQKYDTPILYSSEIPRPGHVLAGGEEMLRQYEQDDSVFAQNLLIFIGIANPERIVLNKEIPCIIADSKKSEYLQIFNKIQDIFFRFEKWNEDLKNTVFNQNGYNALVNCSEEIITVPFSIINKGMKCIACSDSYYESYAVPNNMERNGYLPWKHTNDPALRKSINKLLTIKDVYFFTLEENDYRLLLKNLYYQNIYIGHVAFILPDSSDIEYYTALLEIFHYYVEKMYAHPLFSSESPLEETLLLLAVKKLRGERITDETWQTAYEELGWETAHPLLAILYHVNPLYDNSHTGKDVFAQTLNAELRQNWKGVIGFQYNSDYLMIVNTVLFSSNDSRDLYQSLAYFLRDNLLVAGISNSFRDMDQLPSATCEAAAALEIGMIKAPTMWYHKFEDHILSYIHKNSVGKLSRESVCSPALHILKEYDQKHDMQYYETLLTYFQCLLNASETAKRLCIQRSSLLYRLERIRALTGLTLASYEEIKYLYISFSIMEEDTIIFQANTTI